MPTQPTPVRLQAIRILEHVRTLQRTGGADLDRELPQLREALDEVEARLAQAIAAIPDDDDDDDDRAATMPA